jgi:hypothetical protein
MFDGSLSEWSSKQMIIYPRAIFRKAKMKCMLAPKSSVMGVLVLLNDLV